MKKIKNDAKYWDYDMKKMNPRNPRALVWRLNRKLKFGDLSGIKKSDLKKYFSKLDINLSLKELLRNFLVNHV